MLPFALLSVYREQCVHHGRVLYQQGERGPCSFLTWLSSATLVMLLVESPTHLHPCPWYITGQQCGLWGPGLLRGWSRQRRERQDGLWRRGLPYPTQLSTHPGRAPTGLSFSSLHGIRQRDREGGNLEQASEDKRRTFFCCVGPPLSGGGWSRAPAPGCPSQLNTRASFGAVCWQEPAWASGHVLAASESFLIFCLDS
jgi:hypothetical protein